MKGKAIKEPWIVFYLGGKEVMAYTVRGTFEGELESTLSLIAGEHECQINDIEWKEEIR